jgi:PAS domain S-box-containing protein
LSQTGFAIAIFYNFSGNAKLFICDSSAICNYLLKVFRTMTQEERPKNYDDTSPQSAELFHSIVEDIKDYAIFMTDAAGIVVSWNPGVGRLLGYTESEIVGQPISVIFTEEDVAADVPAKEMELAAQTGRAEDKRWHVRRDGSRFWANGLVMPLKNADGSLSGFAKVMRDDTSHKLAEENLNHQKILLESLTESVQDGIIIVSPEGKILHFNRHFLDIWNFPAEVIEAKSDERALEWAANQTMNPAEFLSRVNQVYEQPDHEVREELLMKDGRVYERFGAPILSGDMRLGWVWTFREITESKRAETNLALLAEISQDLARLDGVAEIMQTVGAKIGAYLNLSACAFVEIYDAANEAIVNHAWNQENVPKLVGIYQLKDFLTDEFQKAARAGEMFIVRDTATDSRTNAARYAELKSNRSSACHWFKTPIGAFCSSFIIPHRTIGALTKSN